MVFLVVSNTNAECLTAQQKLISVLISLGFSVKWEKVVGPTQRIKFLGLVIDSVLERIELPHEKMQHLASLASTHATARHITKHELQVLIGHMSFASRALYGARPFTRLFIDEMSKLRKPSHRTRLTKKLQAELTWWSKFAQTVNGHIPCSMATPRARVEIITDASLRGFGAVMAQQWLAGTWHEETLTAREAEKYGRHWLPSPQVSKSLSENINFLELVAACVAVLAWAPLLSGSQVHVISDNTATVAFLNRGTTAC